MDKKEYFKDWYTKFHERQLHGNTMLETQNPVALRHALTAIAGAVNVLMEEQEKKNNG